MNSIAQLSGGSGKHASELPTTENSQSGAGQNRGKAGWRSMFRHRHRRLRKFVVADFFRLLLMKVMQLLTQFGSTTGEDPNGQ